MVGLFTVCALKTPLIAQHLVCAGGLRVPGNPFSKQPIKKKKNLQACDLTQRCTQLPKREMTDKILRSMKKNTRRRQSAAAALFDSGAQ